MAQPLFQHADLPEVSRIVRHVLRPRRRLPRAPTACFEGVDVRRFVDHPISSTDRGEYEVKGFGTQHLYFLDRE